MSPGSSPGSSTVAERIADFTHGLTAADLPPRVREKLEVAVLHNLGMALAAGDGAAASFRYAEAVGPGSGARLLLTGTPVAPDTAAFVNATLIHARAQDDVYFPGLTHVGATLTPAVLALGEALDSSGDELLAALAAGYEAAGALSQGVAVRTTARGFRATGIYGVLGAAAGAARLLGLDRDATVAALAIATSLAAGTNQTWVTGSQEWQFQVGFAARGGLMAARLAAAGGDGAPDAFEGAQGFYAAFLGAGADDRADVDRIGTDLGTTWRLLGVTYKPYPVCAILQSPVTAAAALHAGGAAVDSAVVTLSPADAAYPGTDATGPFRGVGDALMSAQFCLAVALRHGTVSAADLRRTGDEGLLALARRIEVRADPELAARAFRLQVRRVDGSRAEHASAGADQFDWDRAGVLAQLRGMVAELPASAVDRLAAAVTDLGSRSVRDLVSACVTGPAPEEQTCST